MLVHFFLLKLPYPVSTSKFFASLFPLVAFDLFPAEDWIYGPKWGFDTVESKPIS